MSGARDTIAMADRLAIHDCLLFYSYSMDRGDPEGVASCFTPGGVIVNAAGDRYPGHDGVYRFADTAMKSRGFRGRQHHIKPLFFQAAPDGYRVSSYYQVLTSPAGGAPRVISLGAYTDDMVLHDGQWKIKAKVLHHTDSKTPPSALGGEPLLRTIPGGCQPVDSPSPADRAAMERLMMTYAAALDVADVPGMTAAFAPGAVLESGGVGKVFAPEGIRTFLAASSHQPGFGGRQHRIFPLVWRREGKGWRAYSYWKVETWAAGQAPSLVGIGWYDDVFERRDGEWRFIYKAIRRWNSDVAPMAPGWVAG